MFIDRTVIGRHRERAEIAARLGATADRGADALVFVGAAGFGKSALLRAAATDTNVDVRHARVAEWEQEQQGSLADLLDLESISGPTLLLIDDADSADLTSWRALVSFIRHHAKTPVLVVATARTPTPTIEALTTSVWRLPPMTVGEVSELARKEGRVLHPHLARRLHAHVGGVPRHAVDLLNEVHSADLSRPDSRLPAPRTIRQDVERAMNSLSPDARSLVEALCVLDQRGSLATAIAVADVQDTVRTVSEMDQAGLVRWHREREPHLATPLVSAAVHDLMSVERITELHSRAAEFAGDDVARLRHQVASTLVADDELADRVEHVALTSANLGSWEEASSLYGEAARLTTDARLGQRRIIMSFDALVAEGNVHAAVALVPQVEAMPETPLRNAALAYMAMMRGRSTEAEARLARAWELVDTQGEPRDAAVIAQRYVLHNLLGTETSALVSWAEQAIALADPGSATEVEASAIRGLGLAGAGGAAAARATYAELTDSVRHGPQVGRITLARGWLAQMQDRLDEARPLLETTVSSGVLGTSARIQLWAFAWLARAEFRVGEWDAAMRTVERGRTLAAETGIVLATPLLEYTAAQVHSLRGDDDAADQAVIQANSVPRGYQLLDAAALLARAHVAEARADYATVVRALDPLTRLHADSALNEPGYLQWVTPLANALAMQGEFDCADHLLRPHEARAARSGCGPSIAAIAQARGRLEGARGELSAARAAFETALGKLTGEPLPYENARVRFAYGQALRRAGRRREADDMLTAARELWAGLGANTYVARCDAELKAGGVRVLRGESASSTLSAQETVVADLVASGLSNQDVATQLFISPKTVQYHLTRIYAKLGVRGRTELAHVHRGTTTPDRPETEAP